MKTPSVTTVLGLWADFSGIRPDVLAYAADRGTRAHAACTAYALGFPVVGMQDDCAGFLESFKPWFDQYVAEVYFAEMRLHCRTYLYNGKADLCVRLADGRIVIVDLKTPVAQSKTWPVQVAAYRHLANGWFEAEGLPERVDEGMVLQIDRDGKPATARRYPEPDRDFNVFISALNCYHYFQSKG